MKGPFSSATEALLTSAPILAVLFVILAIGGWIANAVKLYGMISDNVSDLAITGELVFRIIGIFAAPLGAVLGYF